ncbi:hypothetical protein [Companilactobacillus sp. FL22-1]
MELFRDISDDYFEYLMYQELVELRNEENQLINPFEDEDEL